ncbi:MAG: MFS transporter [Phenylobacterium sp.]|uniref:MFS transporter n=1 Tax=Phenylobacterium sp. TaxID=1871053 RepID=UPI0025DCF50F|nr:MFS transporter [Phenylobacterium sp.]MCA3739186.1 MFS transporter [Phenylobacterium sp.]
MAGSDNQAGAGPPGQLSNWRLAAYGGLTIPLAAAGLPIAIYVAPLYTDHIGLGFTAVGLALMATRVLAIVVDPLIGRLSDATRGRLGRRIPWILAGAPIMMFGVWRTFMPSADATAVDLFVSLSILYLGWAMMTVPYGAWGAELSPDYHERSRIAGARELFSVVGLLLAVTFPLLVRPAGLEKMTDRNAIETAAIAADVAALGWATLVLLPPLLLVLVRFVPVSAHTAEAPVGSQRFGRDLLRNRPFLLLLGSTFFAGLSSGMNQTTVVHYYRYRAGLGDAADVMVFAFFAAAVVGAFFWVWLGRRMVKHHVMAAASLLSLIASLAVLAIAPGDIVGFMLVQAVSGFAYAGPLILGASMAADVIDLDWLKSGLQRGAAFIAVWEIGKKLSEAAGVGIALPLMETMGFSAHTASEPNAQLALITVNVLLPAVFALTAIPFILAYPIDEKRQRIVRAALDRKLGRLAARDHRAAEEAALGAGKLR